MLTVPILSLCHSHTIQIRMRSPLHRWALALAVAQGLCDINGERPVSALHQRQQQTSPGRGSPQAFLLPPSVLGVSPGAVDAEGRVGVATTTAVAAPTSMRDRVVGRGRHRRRSRVSRLEARKGRVAPEEDEYRWD